MATSANLTDRTTNRSALRSAGIATATALPLTFILALALANSGDDKPTAAKRLGAVQVAAPSVSGKDAGACNKVLAALPSQLDELKPRQVRSTPESPYVLAWGDPAVVLRCGVPRPADLIPTERLFFIGKTASVYWLQTKEGTDSLFTAVDRAVFIDVRVARAQGSPPLPSISDAIAKSLPPVCRVPETQRTPADDRADDHAKLPLCSRR